MSNNKDVHDRNVVTRFAPSPTGFLHIGGARTALFNWLYARHTGGTFLLRIEDTDRERSTDAAIEAILDGMRWLELDWAGEPTFQYARADRHRAVAEELLASGHAYRCYLTPDELAAMRADAEAAKRPLIIQSPWRERDPAEAPAGIKPAIRLRTPRDGETVVEDKVQGTVRIPNKDLDDLIILRSDGNPTYNFAVVVDDHDMGVTHVIRGVDHLTNAARQTQVYDALGWAVPVFAHVPLIHGPDGAKLSKRHGAQGVGEYRAMGYLPAAVRNYLVRLGWSHGDQEVFSSDEMIALFDIERLGKSAARFDFAKLGDLNGQYIRKTDDAELLARTRQMLPEIDNGPALAEAFERAGWDRFAALMPALKERAKTLLDIVQGARFLIAERPLALDEKAQKQLTDDSRAHLAAIAGRMAALADWSAATIEADVRAYAEAASLGLGKVAQPLRAALTGTTVSPPVFDVMAVLGREEALARIADQTRT
ncbi:MAG: glutamate--tRNA ligase [Hyphomicrobiaceae bacterium]